MVNVRPMKIPGRWRDGYALDHHTVNSTYLGDDEFGHAQFDTKRSDVGELLYQLKYKSDASTVASIVETVASFVALWKPGVDLIVPFRHRGPDLLNPSWSLPTRSRCGSIFRARQAA